ncbi:bifunctional 2',3'-cyclic-nucleotide 2'-phosphodiesterase/3'-nucleotidase [Pseudorhodobacter sp.]|uniref:bifunctional 2',3'-cyclic-nucleotide 2'-phosphodiesterase/3'-nucleotidase n=1 Tax=Pseudorhodobacter sp. TaxID=1934400 RepID=UPI002648745D|nr:bifunctional 2',3'-cyclic-nucleotide 2'-phosphodiesterase/3'-nucleotidase [Pseudorhodobacter sp.]MDN5787534.1 bifunctional 2',3'-cyclic-nucleotide 2'-phosphodiesterase/3'-nucleotidase [Pseudorhodobacter sp.]
MIQKPRPFQRRLGTNRAHLRILQTTDLHAHIFPFDYYNDVAVDHSGLARTATLIATGREEVANSILLDNGDFLQGSALGDYIAYDRGLKQGDLHPVIGAMNRLGYDAATLGNHEFNFGVPFLMASIARANFPVISANALLKRGATPREDQRLLPPYLILDRRIRDTAGVLRRIRIGVIGLLPPQFVTWDESKLWGRIESRDIVETAAALIPEMKAAGTDIIVALAHTGIGASQHVDGMENAALPLARLDGIDVLVAGHTHKVFPSAQFSNGPEIDLKAGTIAGKPAVMAGFCGSHLGVIDLLLEQEGTSWNIVASQSEARPIAALDPTGHRAPLVVSDTAVLKATQHDHDATLDYMRSPVGATRRRLCSYFSLVTNCHSVQMICRAQSQFIRQSLTDPEHAGLPLLSAAAPFKAGGWAGVENYTDIPVGPLFQRSVADLYCFPNTISALRLRGSDIAEWLERSAMIFNHLTIGASDQLLLNDAVPSYGFDVIMGLTYEIDPTQPPRYSLSGRLLNPEAHRIRNLCHNGKPLDPEAEFIVATNNFRASTQMRLVHSPDARLVFEAPTTIRNILLNFITQHGTIDPEIEPNWSLTVPPDTSYLLKSSPLGQHHLCGVNDLSLEPLTEVQEGFMHYRVTARFRP